MSLIFHFFVHIASPLEQFEISSFVNFLTYISTFPCVDLNIEFNFSGLPFKFFNLFIFFCFWSLIFFFQHFFKQKGYFMLFIMLYILITNFNFFFFSEFFIIYTDNLAIGYEKLELFTEEELEAFKSETLSSGRLFSIDAMCDAFGLDADYVRPTPLKPDSFYNYDLEHPITSPTIPHFIIDNTEQVMIEPNFYLDYLIMLTSFFNIYSVFFCFIFIYIILYLIYNKMLSNNTNTLIPTFYQILGENFYKISLNLFYSILGKQIIMPEFFIKINTIFIFLIFSNIQGMIPYMSTLTSALTNTFFIALALFINILTTLFDKKGFNYFLNLFMPSGCPILLSLLIIPIEIISYSFRLISLSVRLFANMMAGHTLLKVIVGFSWVIIFLGNTSLVNLFPIAILFILTLLEFGVALIQAYIFTILSCMYLRDIFMGH